MNNDEIADQDKITTLFPTYASYHHIPHGWLLLFLLYVKSSLLSHFLTQNIFLTDNGTIKLGDFGSACILNRYKERKAADFFKKLIHF